MRWLAGGLWLALTSAAQTPAPQAAPEFTFKTAVDVVTVLCSVHDREGRLVGNLQPSDFQIREQGVPQTIRYFARESGLPLTIGVLMDVSGSMRRMIDAEKKVVGQFFRQVLRPQDMAYLMSFDMDVRMLQPPASPGANHKAVRTWIERLTAYAPLAAGGASWRTRGRLPHPVPLLELYQWDANCCTRLLDAVQSGATEMRRFRGRKIIVVVTDGFDAGSKAGVETALRAAQDSDAVIYAIQYFDYDGYFRNVRLDQDIQRATIILNRLTEETGGRLFPIDRDHPVSAALGQIESEMRTQYSLGYTPAEPAPAGAFRRLSVAARQPNLTVRARKGYYGAGGPAGSPPAAAQPVPAEAAPVRTATLAAAASSGPERPAPARADPPAEAKALPPETLQISLSEPACPLGEDELNAYPALSLARLERLRNRPAVLTDMLSEGIQDPAARQLLGQVAQTYHSLQTAQFEVAWSYQEDAHRLRGGARIAYAFEPGGKLRLDVHSEEIGSYNRSPYTASFQVIDDGYNRWIHLPRENLYSRSAIPGAAAENPSVAAVSGVLVGRYASVVNFPPDARIAGRDTWRMAGRKVDCTIVRGRGPVVGMTEEFWIDDASHLVVLDRVRDYTGRIQGTLTWTMARIHRTAGEGAFSFRPPAGARGVGSLGIPEPRNPEARFSMPDLRYTSLRVRPHANFAFRQPDGSMQRIQDLRGKVVVLAFWEPWCRTSVEEMHRMARFHRAHEAEGLLLYHVSSLPLELAREVLPPGTAPRTIIPDVARVLRWGFRINALPAALIIDRQGRVAGYYGGVHREEDLVDAVRRAGL